jgi:hypothetical protein
MRLISEQVQILLERMDTHPEDFYSDNSYLGVIHSRPWLDLVKSGSFTLVERVIINKKLKQLRRDMTKNRIITLLVEPRYDEFNEDSVRISTTSRFTQGNAIGSNEMLRAQQKQENEAVNRALRKKYGLSS